MAKRAKQRAAVPAKAWWFEGGLCRWAMPTRAQLKQDGKPSPEAVVVSVMIVPLAEYDLLLKAAKANQ